MSARILKEAAFWDVYYEHCSYFGEASLSRLFGQTGFVVRRVWTGYDDQYLMIASSPAGRDFHQHAGDADEVAAIVRASRKFAVEVGRRRGAWLQHVSRLDRRRATHCSLGVRIKGRRTPDDARRARRDRVCG